MTCQVFEIARQPYYRWLAQPVSEAERDEAHLADADLDAQRDDPAFGYRFPADEMPDAGLSVCERTVWNICSPNGWWSSFGKKGPKNKRAQVQTPAHDDLVRREFRGSAPNHSWLGDITEHWTREGKCAIEDVLSATDRRLLDRRADESPSGRRRHQQRRSPSR